MSIKTSQAILKCFINLKSSVWFTLGSEDETVFCDTYRTLFSSTAGQGFQNTKWPAVYKSGTGTMGRGHWDAFVGTWDLGTRDEGLEDIKYGTRGRVGRGRGTSNTGTQGTRDANNYCKSQR